MVENKKNFVVDASVIAKWVLDEPEDREQALLMMKQFAENKVNLFVPAHFFSEVSNIIGRKSPKFATSFISELLTSPITECRLTIEAAAIAFDLMGRHKKISFYDAFYHALALDLGCDFITADRKYYETAKGEGGVRLLHSFAG
jgi:predicted nucleic acid-binding protein